MTPERLNYLLFNRIFLAKMCVKHKKSDVMAIFSLIQILAADHLQKGVFFLFSRICKNICNRPTFKQICRVDKYKKNIHDYK